MDPSCFIDIQQQDEQLLLDIAARSIDNGLEHNCPLEIADSEYRGILREPLGVFVTLTENNELRGCMGCLETSEALVQSVSRCAFNAAFSDPRFPRLRVAERSLISIEISVLSAMMPMVVDSRQSLFEQLIPGKDGLLLEYRGHRATFLPQVWEKLPQPQAFLEQLLLKAGLAADFWSDSIRFYRYHSYAFHD